MSSMPLKNWKSFCIWRFSKGATLKGNNLLQDQIPTRKESPYEMGDKEIKLELSPSEALNLE